MDANGLDPDLGHIHTRPPTHDPLACGRWWQGVTSLQAPAWLNNEVA